MFIATTELAPIPSGKFTQKTVEFSIHDLSIMGPSMNLTLPPSALTFWNNSLLLSIWTICVKFNSVAVFSPFVIMTVTLGYAIGKIVVVEVEVVVEVVVKVVDVVVDMVDVDVEVVVEVDVVIEVVVELVVDVEVVVEVVVAKFAISVMAWFIVTVEGLAEPE